MSQVVIERTATGNRARMALGAGVLAAVMFFGVAMAFEGIWWVVAFVVGVIAVGLAAAALRAREPGRGLAITGGLLGGVIVVWFLAFIIVEAVS